MIAVRQRVIAVTVPWPAEGLTDFLRRFDGRPRFHWEHGETAFAGAGIAAAIRAEGPDRYDVLRREMADLFAWLVHDAPAVPEAVGPKLFGGFAFAPDEAAHGPWAPFGGAAFLLPELLLTHHAGEGWLTALRVIEPEADIDATLAGLRHTIEAVPAPTPDPAGGPVAWEEGVSRAGWHHMIGTAVERIRGGDLEKVVLSRARHLHGDFSVPAVLDDLRERYPGCYRFLIEVGPGQAFLGATPEVLAATRRGRLDTVALAGSIARGETPAADERLGQALLHSTKDRHEHALRVDMLRDALTPLTTALFIDDEPHLHRLGNIQHLSTPVNGWLEDAVTLLDVVERLHPTPALGGHPREA
ncbi:MAG: isochorismate synthase, partial [Chloroflexi bacterium]|nr:isochorismate synthase [Chloroflexota bacterium]